jgi:hypothetical protein
VAVQLSANGRPAERHRSGPGARGAGLYGSQFRWVPFAASVDLIDAWADLV